MLHRFITGNIARWNGVGERVRLDVRAASDQGGVATLKLPHDCQGNLGLATLEAAEGSASHEVETVRLDEVIDGRRVGVLKIDVEAHELTALEGARDSLSGGLIRDIIFEDHDPLPSPVSSMLVDAGFTISGVEETLRCAVLTPPDRVPRTWDAPTYLATRDPERTRRLMAARGWQCLRGRRNQGNPRPIGDDG
jgi:FkbM family methyltransferase